MLISNDDVGGDHGKNGRQIVRSDDIIQVEIERG
jgi:hypothetical protein